MMRTSYANLPFFTILYFRKLFAEAEEEQRKVCLLRENVYCNFKTPSLKVGEQFLMLDDMYVTPK